MITLKKAAVVAVAAIGMSLGIAAPAGADTDDDPCQLAVNFLCKFVPMAPDLDHDIDLTKNPGAIDGQTLPEMPSGNLDVEGAPPAPVCLNGCI
jgi:hypothetical protein